MALDTRIALAINPPEIDNPSVSYARALENRRGEQVIDENALILEEMKAKAQVAREARMRQAKIKQILASSPTPHDALVRLEQDDPEAAHELKGQFADHTLKLLMGVSNYQAVPSAWPEVQKYLGADAPMPTFQNQDEFDQWKRQQILARADFKTYLEQTKPSAQQAGKTREVTIQNPDGSTRIMIIKDEPGQEFTSAPKPATAAGATGFTLSPDQIRYDAAGKEIAHAPARPEKAGGGQNRRAVTSGDANKIAELNNSLRDLEVLSTTISGVAGATGTSAALGASLPNFVTNATGWGTEAKEKQAMIDRIKQVIGKTLEGGVLRKEDEDKYKKILPTISDAPDVVTSKLNGLRDAIDRKRDEQLSALEDAGYDTSRFRAREAAVPKNPAKKAPPKKVGRFTIEEVD